MWGLYGVGLAPSGSGRSDREAESDWPPVLTCSRSTGITDGGWRRFPFHFTLLALTGMNGKNVVDEMQYAAPRLERMLKRQGRGDRFDKRRRAVAERVLASV